MSLLITQILNRLILLGKLPGLRVFGGDFSNEVQSLTKWGKGSLRGHTHFSGA